MKTYTSEVQVHDRICKICTIHMCNDQVFVTMQNQENVRVTIGTVTFAKYRNEKMFRKPMDILFDVFAVNKISLLYDHLIEILDVESDLPQVYYGQDCDGRIVKVLPVCHREARATVFWTLQDIIEYINSFPTTDEWQGYNHCDWVEGWKAVVELAEREGDTACYSISNEYLNQNYFKY